MECRIHWSHNQSVYLLELHRTACWHPVYIIISTSQQDALCPTAQLNTLPSVLSCCWLC